MNGDSPDTRECSTQAVQLPKPKNETIPKKKSILSNKKILIPAIIAVVIIAGLLATTIIFALNASSANERARDAEAKTNKLSSEYDGMKEMIEKLKPVVEDATGNMVKAAQVLMVGSLTQDFFDLTKKVSYDLGTMTGMFNNYEKTGTPNP